jgi:hypothetical protein
MLISETTGAGTPAGFPCGRDCGKVRDLSLRLR